MSNDSNILRYYKFPPWSDFKTYTVDIESRNFIWFDEERMSLKHIFVELTYK